MRLLQAEEVLPSPLDSAEKCFPSNQVGKAEEEMSLDCFI